MNQRSDPIRNGGAPGILFWQYRVDEKTFQILGPPFRRDPYVNLERFFNNLSYGHKFILRDDFSRFKLFVEGLRSKSPGEGIFRYLDLQGNQRWLKVRGERHPDTGNLRGFLLDVTEDVDTITGMIQHRDVPVRGPGEGKGHREREEIRKTIQYQSFQKKSMTDILQVFSDHHYPDAPFHRLAFLHTRTGREEARFYISRGEDTGSEKPEDIHCTPDFMAHMMGKDSSYVTVQNVGASPFPNDWALFVPREVVSYLSRPLMLRRRLQGILYFCSPREGFFSPSGRDKYADCVDLFLRVFQSWRLNPV